MKIGRIEINFPDAVSNKFAINCDLAEIFNLEYQSEAVSKTKDSIKNNEISPKPFIDYESDMVFIESLIKAGDLY